MSRFASSSGVVGARVLEWRWSLMQGRTRLLTIAVLSLLATALVGASLAWACTAPDYGTPSSPSPPPSPPASSSPAGGSSGTAQGTPVFTGGGSGSAGAAPSTSGAAGAVTGSTSGASHAGTSAPSPAPRRATSPRHPGSGASSSRPVATRPAGTSGSGAPPAAVSARPAATYGASALHARESGATAGVTHGPDGQPVFSSSTAPKGKAAGKRHATPAARAHSPAPSARSATGDLWSGVASPSRPSFSATAAPASAGAGGGVGSGVLVGSAILGLGLVGLLGAAFVVGEQRRRRVKARAGKSSGTPTSER